MTNQELTDAYRRVTEQFKDLQLKVTAGQSESIVTECDFAVQVKHFELSDAQKFEEVWQMKEQESRRWRGHWTSAVP